MSTSKNIGFLFILTLIMASCSLKKATKSPTPDYPKGVPIMIFDKDFHDFGKVKKGEKREVTFNFTNEGDVDLEVELMTSCHCTTLDYSLTPVPPKGTGSIHAIFDSSEKTSSDIIDITIILKNTNPQNGYPIVHEVKFAYELIE